MRLEEVQELLSRHKAEIRDLGIKSLAVFGSVARGEATAGSDVDILVEFNRPIGLFGFIDVKDYLESILGCKVDLVTPDGLHPALKDIILREAVNAA